MDYVKLLDEIKAITVQQGEILEHALKSDKDIKYYLNKKNSKDLGDIDLNTELDKEIEKVFYVSLSKDFPQLGFHLEEQPELNDSSKEFTCFIDPIDGSKYFAKKVPFFAISIGNMRGDEPVLGVIYNPISNQLYAGGEGIPTTLNGKKVSVSSQKSVKKAIISACLSSHKENWDSEKDWMMKKLTILLLNFGKVRLLGNGALSCAWTSSGGIDGFVSLWGHESKPYDIMAGKALIKYAGGKTVDLKIPGIKQPRFVGGNEVLVDEICEILLK